MTHKATNILILLPFALVSLAINIVAMINYTGDILYYVQVLWCLVLISLGGWLSSISVPVRPTFLYLTIIGVAIGLIPYDISFPLIAQIFSGTYGADAFRFPASFSGKYWMRSAYEVFSLSFIQVSVFYAMALTCRFLGFRG